MASSQPAFAGADFSARQRAFRRDASGIMSTHFDPEGNPSVLTDYSTLSLFIPAEQSDLLRPNMLTIPKQEAGYELSMVAWHKRSNPNAALPWVASRGQRIGPVVFAWDDSAEDGDYRDVRIKLVTS